MQRIEIKNPPYKLSIGCGNPDEIPEGYVGLDILDLGQEIVWDLKDGIPLPDNSCSDVYASHILEHFDANETIKLMGEIWRVLMPNGKLEIISPDKSSKTAHFPEHLQQLSLEYFRFFESIYCRRRGGGFWKIAHKRKIVKNKINIELILLAIK